MVERKGRKVVICWGSQVVVERELKKVENSVELTGGTEVDLMDGVSVEMMARMKD